MDLTTLARVKSALSTSDTQTFSSEDELELSVLISSVSVRMERLMGRQITLMERSDTFEVDPTRKLLSLPSAPVTSVSSLKVAATADFTDAEALVENTDYILRKQIGLIRFIESAQPLLSLQGVPLAPLYAQVTWTGGWATDADKLANNYADVVQAATLQVVHLWRRRGDPGENIKVSSGAETQFGDPEYALLKEVLAVCRFYFRRPG